MKFFKKISTRLQNDSIFLYAACISFYTIISLIPFLVVLFGILEYIPLPKKSVFRAVIPSIPSELIPLFKHISAEVFSEKTKDVLPVSAISLLFTASRGVNAALRGVRNIYKGQRNGFFRLLFVSILYTILLLAVISLFLIPIASVITMQKSNGSSIILNYFVKVAAFFLSSAVFSLMYILFCGRALPFFLHFPGGVFTAFFQTAFSTVFSLYTQYFADYSAVYGSLAAIIILFLWIYFSAVIFLLGAELNMFLIEL